MTKIDLTDSLEKIPVKIFPDSGSGSVFVAKQIAEIRLNQISESSHYFPFSYLTAVKPSGYLRKIRIPKR